MIRFKQVLSEMGRKSLEIRNEYLALEECLNLLFPSLNSRSTSIFQRAPSPKIITTNDTNATVVEETEKDISPPINEEEKIPDDKIRSDSPPPEIPKSSLPGLQRDLQHLLSNQLKRTRPSTNSNDQRSFEIPAEDRSLGFDGHSSLPILVLTNYR